MQTPARTTYSPVVHPRDLASLPDGLGTNDELHVPLPPTRAPSVRPASWLRRFRDQHRLILGFCYTDRLLLHWDAHPGEAETQVSRIAPAAALTLDIPYYGFMTAPQRQRALLRSLAAIDRALRCWEPLGTEVIPLVKGLHAADWEPQLAFAQELGLRRAAFYSRECLLERDGPTVRAFLKESRRHRLRPLLMGAFTPRPPADGGFDAAGSYHYVLARLRRYLTRSGRAHQVPGTIYSSPLGRFVSAGDRRGLTQHNFLQARRLLERAHETPLAS